MVFKKETAGFLREFFTDLLARAGSNAKKIELAVYPLLGLIVLNRDEGSEIEIYTAKATSADILWITVNKKHFALSYNPTEAKIKIREGSIRGPVALVVDNDTGLAAMKDFFESRKKGRG